MMKSKKEVKSLGSCVSKTDFSKTIIINMVYSKEFEIEFRHHNKRGRNPMLGENVDDNYIDLIISRLHYSLLRVFFSVLSSLC